MKHQMTLEEAQRQATAIVELLRPCCERIEIAGSIRRCREMVGDIEIEESDVFEALQTAWIDPRRR